MARIPCACMSICTQSLCMVFFMSNSRFGGHSSSGVFGALLGDLAKFPVSFSYGDKSFSGFPKSDFKQVSHKVLNKEARDTHTIVLQMRDKLQVKIQVAFYHYYGAYEWTVWFENHGEQNSQVISNLVAADMQFPGEKPVLKGILGDHDNLYRPYVHDLAKAGKEFVSLGGRPTHINFPYFNLEHGNGGSLIAIGWGGTWSAAFEYSGCATGFKGVSVPGLATYLKPGESLRTALVAVLPYDVRDEDYATNLWRSWYINCNMPRLNAKGDPIAPFSASGLAVDTGLPNSDGSISERHFTWKPSLEKMISEGITAGYRWFDAGWYFDPAGNTVEKDWWGTIGSWELDTEKWPDGSFRQSVDFSRRHGMKTLMWFEPERVTHVDDLVKNHGYKAEWALPDGKHTIVNNIGDPECLRWTLGRILKVLDENDVDMYREDNNANHAVCWKMKDELEGENRAGITEVKAVCAHYALWDGIIAHQKAAGRDAFVDSCASGGGRNDLESMRRGIPLLRSDFDRTCTSLRLSMTTSFNRWIPMCGSCTTEQEGQVDVDGRRDKYIFRASYNPIFNFSAQWVQDPDTDFDVLRFGINEWNAVKDYTLKDFYLLTDWNDQDTRTSWTAYAYHDHERDAALLLAFRMEEAQADTATVGLRMLDPDKDYNVRDFDTGKTTRVPGRELVAGYTVTLPQPRMAAVFEVSAV